MISSTTKGDLSELSKGRTEKGVHIVINGHYYLKSLKAKHNDYNFYKGIDVSKARWVHIYGRQVDAHTLRLIILTFFPTELRRASGIKFAQRSYGQAKSRLKNPTIISKFMKSMVRH
jgi:hypothetical protein